MLSIKAVQFQSHTYKARWAKFVEWIKKRPDTLSNLLESAVGAEMGEYDEQDDPELMGECPTDSEVEG
jgi:hypothetical protein